MQNIDIINKPEQNMTPHTAMVIYSGTENEKRQKYQKSKS